MFFRLKISGGALYIALIISIVIGITLSLFIVIASFNQRQVVVQLALTQLRFDLASGFNVAISASFSDQYNNTWQKSFFNDDSLRIKKLQWGAFQMIGVESKNRHQYMSEAGFYGVASSKDTAIMIADKNRPVSLSGKIIFNGGCYFPKAGIKPAYIEGESFSSNGSPSTFLRQAPSEIPGVHATLTEGLKNCRTNVDPRKDSLIGTLPLIFSHKFSCKTAVLQTGKLHLNEQHLSGNIKLIAAEVTIDQSCELNDIFIVATKVRIKKGFHGCLHVLSSDSVILEDECMLGYPSSLTVFNGDILPASMKGIYLGRNCVVNGALIALSEKRKSPVIIKLNSGCEINGLMYSDNYAQVQGKIFGTVFCQSLLLTTPSSVYENHILGCELDPKKFAGSLAFPDIFKTDSPYKCVKWL